MEGATIYCIQNSAVTTLACNAVFCLKGCARLVCRQALGLAHPQPPDKVSGWLGVGVEKFPKENDMYEVATIVIEGNHCFEPTCLTCKPLGQSSVDSHTFITSHQNFSSLAVGLLT